MRVRFFVMRPWDPDDREPEDTDEFKAANAEYDLELLPRLGDYVSFNEGDMERRVHQVMIAVNPEDGHQSALVELRS